MRKIFKSFMLVAAAAMAFTSCQKEEVSAPETVSVNLTMHAGVEETKTFLGEDNKVLWGKGEAVKLYVGDGKINKFVSSTATDTFDGAETAEFTFSIDGVAEEGPYSLGGIYPASAAMEDNDNPVKFKTILSQTQNAEVGKYDPSAYIMVLKPETVETLPEEYVASFRRATALNKITLTNVKEDITTVEITVPEGKDLAGRRYFNLTDGTSGDIYHGQSNTITVNSKYTGSTIDVWFCSWGVELAAGEELTVRMKNANKSFTRTIQANEAGIKFVEGKLNTLKINMATATEESFSNFSGEWLITGTTGGVTYAAGSYVSGNNIKASVALNISNDVIEPVDGLDKCKMFFTMITEGEYKGMYTIQDANGKYLYAASSSGNQLKAGTSADNANYYWAVECTDGKYTVVASKSSNRNVMQFNGSDASNMLFACYTSASQGAITLYPYSMVKVDTTPKIVVKGATTKDVVFGGETVTFNYELKYLEEELTWEVSDEEMISSVSAEDGVLTVTVAENDGADRTATITLSCGDAEEVVLTINQAEYVDTSVIEKITVAEFLEKSVDANVWYELTGTVSGIANAIYGNFNLVDATGTVYVYGLTATKVASNDQSFASIGLNEGDVVTLIGTRAVYNNNAQVGGPAYYVTHQQVSVAPSISCKDNVVTITTAAFGATIYYTTNGDEPTTESTEYSAPFEITENTTVKAIAIEDGKLVSTVAIAECTWVDPDAENEGVSLGASYSYTFAAKQWSSNNTAKTLGELSWTASGEYNGSGYWGYDSTKGQQFGSAKASAKSLKISTSSYSGGVKTIKVSTCGASSISAKLTVTVNGKQYGSVVSLTSSNKEYTFEVDDADVQGGEIVLSYTNSSAKAIYIKSIKIN